MNQVGNHFGIGIGDKLVTLLFQLTPQLVVVFDNTVVYDRNLTGVVRVGIDGAGLTMGCPSGVSDTQLAFGRVCCSDSFQIRDLTNGFARLQATFIDD